MASRQKTFRIGFGRPADMPPRRKGTLTAISNRPCSRPGCTRELVGRTETVRHALLNDRPGAYECLSHYDDDLRDFKSRRVVDGIAIIGPDKDYRYHLHFVTDGKTGVSFRVTKAQAIIVCRMASESARIGMRVEWLGREFEESEE